MGDDYIKSIFTPLVEHEISLYNETANYAHLIKARQIARANSIPIPESVEEWLDSMFANYLGEGKSLEVAAGLRSSVSGKTTTVTQHHLRDRNIWLYGITNRIRNEIEHLTASSLSQADCAIVAASCLNKQLLDHPQWRVKKGDIKASYIEKRITEWKTNPPLVVESGHNASFLSLRNTAEWVEFWSQSKGVGLVDSIRYFAVCLNTHPPTSISKKDSLLLILLAALEEALQKSGVSEEIANYFKKVF